MTQAPLNQQHRSKKPRTNTVARNCEKHNTVVLRAPRAPQAPVIGNPILCGPNIPFIKYVVDDAYNDFRTLLFGEDGTAAGIMCRELRRATSTLYFGGPKGKPPGPGKLTKQNAKSRKMLRAFARRAYRGDPDRRGVLFWTRIAWLLWNSYELLMKLRRRAKKIKKLEMDRIARIPTQRAQRTAYMRRYRLKRGVKAARSFKPQAKANQRGMRKSKR